MGSIANDKKAKEKLIRNVKKEVKQIMEEAVTRKFVHEDSGTITSLCGAVEACLSQGLRRRALGLFKTSSTTALLHKVAKSFEPAAIISKKVQDIENSDPNRRSSSSGDSVNRPSGNKGTLTSSISVTKPPLQKNMSNVSLVSHPPKYLWIRLALFEKYLARIIDYLVQNSSKYYEKDSLVADPDFGSILSSLLVGPCALDYSKTKTQDHYWTDPPADELVQRHRISSGVVSTPPSSRRPVLSYRRGLHAVSSDDGLRQVPISAKDYVESLHQNSRATLLFGKNNVLVLPKDLTEPIPGYLSLSQTSRSLIIMWTPNQLMNGYSETNGQDKSMYWDYAMNISINDIVYVHCHQQGGSGNDGGADSGDIGCDGGGGQGGMIVLVGQDGVQRPPIHFPRGSDLLTFLSCLENGLLPHGQLDPPLWSQRGKGKVFPKLRRRGRGLPSDKHDESNEEESTDYVFQIISKKKHEDYLAITGQDLIDPHNWSSISGTGIPAVHNGNQRPHLGSSSTSSTSSSRSLTNGDIDAPVVTGQTTVASAHQPKDSLQLLCDSMKHQIISRAFYGWLAYCRHLSTVRKHLSGLVNGSIVDGEGAEEGFTKETWEKLTDTGRLVDKDQVFKLVYYGGVSHEIRKEVWPYLLGHYEFGSSFEERQQVDYVIRQNYETTMSEWLAVEAIVRQRDKEMMAANLVKLSSESTSGEAPPPNLIMQDLANDVFVSLGSDEDDLPLIVDDNDDMSDRKLQINVPKCPINVDSSNKTSLSDIDRSLSTDPALVNGSLDVTTEIEDGLVKKKKVEVENNMQNSQSTDEGMVADDDNSNDIEDDDYDGDDNDGTNNNSSGNKEGDNDDDSDGIVDIVKEEDDDKDSVTSYTKNNCVYKNSVYINAGKTKKVYKCKEKDTGHCSSASTMLAVNEDSNHGSHSACVSPASSQGGVYSPELVETFGLNLHRIEKDVQRCDRNYWYFTPENLEKLRNIMCTYVWEHLDVGYMQGMCDLVAPLLVVFDDEGKTYSCFSLLMERMGANFPHNGGAMDTHFANMRSLIRILDSEMFELMHQNGDYTHFYFCYRWFLLDFKRELVYDDVFVVWETIWAAKHVASTHFVLFIALALVKTYRDIILTNCMDFTDVIKFFNEMAERHDAKAILSLARNLVLQLQLVIENK
ncbi:small G protein signaling modulator 2-like isoform X2 [Lycorma delicatula]|uniref:small G protein signaling modulator 2-like isoform X2 n=1 Tax=Lycorma delicatula TaxID=130591 RepID=UPI003F51748E